LGREQRRRALVGAIRVNPARRERVRGKAILLVDDVFTTGATTGACLRALQQAGAASVDILTLARVVRPELT